jgi:hypothetical protein
MEKIGKGGSRYKKLQFFREFLDKYFEFKGSIEEDSVYKIVSSKLVKKAEILMYNLLEGKNGTELSIRALNY